MAVKADFFLEGFEAGDDGEQLIEMALEVTEALAFAKQGEEFVFLGGGKAGMMGEVVAQEAGGGFAEFFLHFQEGVQFFDGRHDLALEHGVAGGVGCRVIDDGAMIELVREGFNEADGAEDFQAAGADVHFTVGIGVTDFNEADEGAEAAGLAGEHGGDAKGLFGGGAIVDELAVAGFEDVEVEFLAGINDEFKGEYRNELVHMPLGPLSGQHTRPKGENKSFPKKTAWTANVQPPGADCGHETESFEHRKRAEPRHPAIRGRLAGGARERAA